MFSETVILKNMIKTFDISKLQDLLKFCKRSFYRGDSVLYLQRVALGLIKRDTHPVNQFVYALYFNIGFPNGPQQSQNHYQNVLFKHPDCFESKIIIVEPTLMLEKSPSSHYQTQDVYFQLTSHQATLIGGSRIAASSFGRTKFNNKIQIRICRLDTTCEQQQDNFPEELLIKVNDKLIMLPTNPPKVRNEPPSRAIKPIDVTPSCRIAPVVDNKITIIWGKDNGGSRYAFTVELVSRLSCNDLLERLHEREMQPFEYTLGLIKDRFSHDAKTDHPTSSLNFSLVCPLGKLIGNRRMEFPCRATTCSHLDCFDASIFIQMNQKKIVWVCPICANPILYEHLALDSYFSQLINSVKLPLGAVSVNIDIDGEWAPIERNNQLPSESTVSTTSENDSDGFSTMGIGLEDSL